MSLVWVIAAFVMVGFSLWQLVKEIKKRNKNKEV